MPRGGRRAGAGRKRKRDTGLVRAIAQAQDLTLRLLSELDAVTTHSGELEEWIVDETEKDEDGGRRRQAMLKAIALPSRAAILKALLAATRAFAELEARTQKSAAAGVAAPLTPAGKKAAAAAAAASAGQGTEWGNDLDPSPPPGSKTVN